MATIEQDFVSTFPSINPATGEEFAKHEGHSNREAAKILDEVALAQKAWQALTFEQRAVHLRAVAAQLRKEKTELARMMALEMGKPITQGEQEVEKCAGNCDFYADRAAELLADENLEMGNARVIYQPLGTLLAIMPWNFPFWQVVRIIGPVLMAGNAMVLKHAANVTGCAVLIEEVIERAGVPRNVFRTLKISSRQVADVIRHPTISAVTITGSEPAGKAVAAVSAADYLAQFGNTLPAPVDLEEQLAGGNAPAFETALSLSGGDSNTRYYASGLAHKEDGIVHGTFYDKYTLALNLDQALSDRLTLDLRTNGSYSRTARGFTGNDNRSTTYYVTLTGTPSFIDLRKRADGTYPTNVFSNSNPLQTAELVENVDDTYRFFGSVQATWDALRTDQHTFRLLGQAGTDIFNQNNTVYAPEDVQFECLGAGCTPGDQFPGTSVTGDALNRQMNFSMNAVHSFLPTSGLLTATTSAGLQYE
jgi:hypothetical protein